MKNNILSTLNKQQRQYLEVKTFKKGSFLFREGELCSCVTFVASGQVKISSMHYSGNEVVFNLLEKGELFGNNLIFSDSPIYKGDVIALQETVVVIIEKEKLLQLLRCNKDFLKMYLNIQSNFGKHLNSTIKMLSLSSAEERFKFYLYENNNEINYSTITELADILHLKRETLSRLISRLEKENVIKRSLHKIIKID